MLVCDCAFLIAVCIFWGFIFVFDKQLSGLKLIWCEPLDLSEGSHSDLAPSGAWKRVEPPPSPAWPLWPSRVSLQDEAVVG